MKTIHAAMMSLMLTLGTGWAQAETEIEPAGDYRLELPSALYLTEEDAPGIAMEVTHNTQYASKNVQTTEEGEKCYQNLYDDSTIRYMLLKNVAEDLANGLCPKVNVAIVYLDRGRFNIVVRYDSSDVEVFADSKAPGVYKGAGFVRLQNTGSWRVARFQLPDAFFGRRCHGGDLRLQVYGDFDFFIKGVYVQPADK